MSQLFLLRCNDTVVLDENGEPEATSVFGDIELLWLIGIGCSVISSLATAIGTLLQKKAHMIEEAKPDDEKSTLLLGAIPLNKAWLLALVIMVLIPLPFDFVAFATAPQSVIAPMTGLTIVLNQAIAPKLLGESLTFVEIGGTVIIIIGVIVIAVSGGGNPETFNVCQLVDRYRGADVLGIVFAIVGLIALCLFWVHTHRHPVYLEKLRPEMFAFIAGGLGGLMNVAFKATGELVKGEVGAAQTDTWSTIWPYFHVLAVAVLAIGMISYINRGLQLYDAVLFTPLYFTNLIVCSTTLGLIYYKEYEKFRTWQAVVFPLGLIIVCCGILFMSLQGVDISKVRVRAKRLEEFKENRKSLAASSRALGSARTVGLGSRLHRSQRSLQKIGSRFHDDDEDDDHDTEQQRQRREAGWETDTATTGQPSPSAATGGVMRKLGALLPFSGSLAKIDRLGGSEVQRRNRHDSMASSHGSSGHGEARSLPPTLSSSSPSMGSSLRDAMRRGLDSVKAASQRVLGGAGAAALEPSTREISVVVKRDVDDEDLRSQTASNDSGDVEASSSSSSSAAAAAAAATVPSARRASSAAVRAASVRNSARSSAQSSRRSSGAPAVVPEAKDDAADAADASSDEADEPEGDQRSAHNDDDDDADEEGRPSFATL